MDFNALQAYNGAFVFNSNILPVDQNYQQFPNMTPQMNALMRFEDGGGDAGVPFFPEQNVNGNHQRNDELANNNVSYHELNGHGLNPQLPVNNTDASNNMANNNYNNPNDNMYYENVPYIEEYRKEQEFVIHPETVFITSMSCGITKFDIQMHFSKVGEIKMDESTGKVKIFVYKNKSTGRSRGEATVTYTNAEAAQAAITWLNGTRFCGKIIKVVQAYVAINCKGIRFDYMRELQPKLRRDRKKIWKPAADNWFCGKCKNSNFVWRASCNRCKANKSDVQIIRHSNGIPTRTWRPQRSDWHCGYCFNANFWYRKKCNRCGSPKEDVESFKENDLQEIPNESVCL